MNSGKRLGGSGCGRGRIADTKGEKTHTGEKSSKNEDTVEDKDKDQGVDEDE